MNKLVRKVYPLIIILCFGFSVDSLGAQPLPRQGESEVTDIRKDDAAFKRIPVGELNALNSRLREAMALYYDNSYRLALPLLQSLASRIDTIDVLFWLGRAAHKTGDIPLAIAKFKIILERDPTLMAVRLDLARAYLGANDLDSAREELNKILDSDPPETLQIAVEQFITRIDKAGKRWYTNFSVLTGPLYDSNINAGPGDDSIEIAGGTRTLRDLRGKGGWLINTNANGDFVYDFGEQGGFVWQSNLRFLHNQYLDGDEDFNFTRIDFRSGSEYYSRDYRLKLPVGFIDQRFANKELTRAVYVTPTAEVTLSKNLDILTTYRFEHENFVEKRFNAQDNNSHSIVFGPAYSFDVLNNRSVVSLLATLSKRKAVEDRFSYEDWSLGSTYFLSFQTGTELYFSANYLNRDYDVPAFLFPNKGERRDRRYSSSVVLSHTFNRRYIISASYTYIRNDSNVPLFDFVKHIGGINIGLKFSL